MISYGAEQLHDISISSTKEWLLTDGDGGYACSTVCFMNTRREHSLLTVSTNTPLRRLTLLNKVDEEVIIEGQSYYLATNRYPGTIFPGGYKLLSKFTFDYFPQVTFDLDGYQMTKRVVMPKRSSSIFIHYENNSRKTLTIRLLPLLSFRWKNTLKKSGDGFLVDELPDGVRIIADMNLPRLYLKLSQIYNTSPESYWYYNFIYAHDSELYEDDREDLYNIGYWETELEPGKGMTLAASIRDLAEFDYPEIEARFIESIDATRRRSGLPSNYVRLADIASNHIVRNRAIRSPAIIEGYPYGGISIKEALMSLDGISSVSENPNYDLDFLYDLAANEVRGSFPSRVDETSLHVEYDDPQTAFFFAIAVSRCAGKTQNPESVKRYLTILEEAIEMIKESSLAKGKLKDAGLIDSGRGITDPLEKMASDAAANALWYNLLSVVAKAKSSSEGLSVDSELTSGIETQYFSRFFEADGSYKNSGGKGGVSLDMVIPLVVPISPLDEAQRTKICKSLVSGFAEGLEQIQNAAMSSESCNLVALYLAEAANGLKECGEEFRVLKGILEKLFVGQAYANCVNGIPKCAAGSGSKQPQNLSSSVMVGEAIRLIKKFKLK